MSYNQFESVKHIAQYLTQLEGLKWAFVFDDLV